MSPIRNIISHILLDTLKTLSIVPEDLKNIVQISKKNQNCDFQSNIALILAKKLQENPKKLAEKIITDITKKDIFSSIKVASPGFINFSLNSNFINQRLSSMLKEERLSLEKVSLPKKIVVDFSGPNIAKEMHVGHLRSTIIGDSIARILEFAGHYVKRINHIGDWGTQFGMLLALICRKYPNILYEKQDFILSDLEKFYREAKILFDSDKKFVNEAHIMVKRLQSKEASIIDLWQKFCSKSLSHCQEIYQALDIKIDTQGESFYNFMLKNLVEDLKSQSLAVETEGAIGVFIENMTDKKGNLVPCIIQKSDGAYVYATTDLAALKYRIQEEKATQVIYVTDSRQILHFKQIHFIAKKMRWIQEEQMIHIPFGMMLDKDAQPIKTRSGENIKLKFLLDEAEKKAYKIVTKLSPQLSKAKQKTIAQIAGLGGIKYSDLVHSINTDYCFDWDKILATDGNSAIYLLINHARTYSIARKLNFDYKQLKINFSLKEDAEIMLAKKLILLQDIWQESLNNLTPHSILNHIYELARTFSYFWNTCPIIKVSKTIQESRLSLCLCVQKQIAWGLSLIGVEALEEI